MSVCPGGEQELWHGSAIGGDSEVALVSCEALDGVRRLADEDVTIFGEQLQRLGASADGCQIDEETRVDYQRALDAYEAAQRAVAALRDPDEVRKVTDALATGRYALTCVRARIAGEQVPDRVFRASSIRSTAPQ